MGLGKKFREAGQMANAVDNVEKEKTKAGRVVALFVAIAVFLMCFGIVAYTLGLF